jgi:hypothetical protein
MALTFIILYSSLQVAAAGQGPAEQQGGEGQRERAGSAMFPPPTSAPLGR